MEKKIGWRLFSGLIIGPIMGTGIILLPPLVYQVAERKGVKSPFDSC